VVVLGRGKVIADGPLDEVVRVDDPWIQSYFASRATRPAGEPAPKHPAPRDGA
jgi:ABC-type transporter Mla maintaining outer membrane lipid asymmetry ATPase subunit MlaF